MNSAPDGITLVDALDELLHADVRIEQDVFEEEKLTHSVQGATQRRNVEELMIASLQRLLWDECVHDAMKDLIREILNSRDHVSLKRAITAC